MTRSSHKASFALLRGSWEATIDDRIKFYGFVVLFILAYTLDLAVPWAIGYTLRVFVENGGTSEAFRQASLGILMYSGLRMGNIVLHHFARYLQASVTYNAKMHVLTKLFGAMMKYPLRWHISTHSGDNLSKLYRAEGAVANVVGTYVWQVIEGFVKVFGAAIAIFAVDITIAIVVLVMSVLTIVLMVLFNKKLTEKIRKNNSFGNKINRICVDYLVNVVTVKTLGLESQASRYLKDQRSEGHYLSRKIAKYMELKWAMTGVGHGLVIGLGLLIYFHGHTGSNTATNVQEVYVLLNYLDRIFQAIGSFTGYYSGIVEAATGYEDADDILKNASKEDPSSSGARMNSDWKQIGIKEMNFSYVAGERNGLRDIALSIRRGEKIALVGHSGSGKSTFLKVLAGLLAPDGYSISADDQLSLNLDTVTKECLLIPQEPEIFSESVKYNLTMGDEFDSKELQFFVSLCKLDRLMARLPQGVDSNLAEKGLNLSVGEKQRVALARGLLRAVNKSMILLDEPTSSLDPKTEKEIYLGLLYHFADKTIFSACHRLNLVPMFDKIVMFDQGVILEVGTFGELLEKKGYFARAWDDYQSKLTGEQAHALGESAEKLLT
jgi:ATP-binding cassette subfamily B protein